MLGGREGHILLLLLLLLLVLVLLLTTITTTTTTTTATTAATTATTAATPHYLDSNTSPGRAKTRTGRRRAVGVGGCETRGPHEPWSLAN